LKITQSTNNSDSRRIAVIGSGISGLTAAFLLKKQNFDVALFEKSERSGGNIQSVKINDFLIEQGPNSLLKSPRLVDLIRELNLESQILAANAVNKKRYVLRNGHLKSLPMSVIKMAADDYFSWRAKLRLLKEPFVRTKSPENESVAEFFERRLGREIVERAADPFIAGIYAGNPANLGIKSAFPRLYELEKQYGSLLLGSLRSKNEKAPADFPRTFSFINGIQTLTDALAENLGDSVKLNTQILEIKKNHTGKWSITTDSGENYFDALIISTPAEAAANLIANLDAELSQKLKKIYYPPVAMIYFGVKKEALTQKLNGFGFLIPSAEKRRILGTIWNSAVFENRAPVGYDLLTTFVGGARNPELFEKSDGELFEIVAEELGDILGLQEKHVFMHVKRWRKAIPQYEIGYEKVENAIAEFERKNAGIYFCSNFYKGISVGDCIKNAYKTADEIEKSNH
jgi:protoporphyrinogen/coproporphyrinogen III oxidase